MKSLVESWPGLAVVSRFDPASGSWIFIALHDDSLGPPTGGTRLRVYDRPEDGLRDAMRLSEGMTCKWAAVDLPFGGGKAVLALSRALESDERRGLLRTYARMLEALRGGFSTGLDLGTTEDDMVLLGDHTAYVHGVDRDRREARDPGPYTARGVLAAVRAAAEHLYGSGDLSGRSVLVEGVGHVGAPLSRMLAVAGARVVLSDVDEPRARALADELAAEVAPAGEGCGSECDVYSPCAVGSILNRRTIPRLRCAAVVGAANNQLERPSDAEALRRRGILHAPDFIANAGGATAFGLLHLGVTEESEILRRVDGIGESLRELFAEADRARESPVGAARRRVEAVLERARREREGSGT